MEKLEQKLKEMHKDIIFDICMNINNCANCYNEETRQTDCYSLQCVETYDLSENFFVLNLMEKKQINYYAVLRIGMVINLNLSWMEKKLP